jgi:hypothetical protein
MISFGVFLDDSLLEAGALGLGGPAGIGLLDAPLAPVVPLHLQQRQLLFEVRSFCVTGFAGIVHGGSNSWSSALFASW